MLGRSGLGLVSERDFFRVLSTVSSSSLLVMSSDPFADLASSTEAFAREFREFMTRNPRPASGSPADKEAQGEPFAGDWSEHPSSDIFATTYLTATSCTDHLLGLADVLRARNALFAAYTLTRGAVEAAALGCYLTDQGIDSGERVRRTVNYRLDAMCARVWLFTDMHGDYAAEKLDETRQRIADFARGARQHSFSFHDMNGKGRAAHIGSAQPAAMNLSGLRQARIRQGVCHSGQRGPELQVHAGCGARWPRADLHQIAELVHDPQATAPGGVARIWAQFSRLRVGDLAYVMDLADDLAAGGPQRQLSRFVRVRQRVSGQFAN